MLIKLQMDVHDSTLGHIQCITTTRESLIEIVMAMSNRWSADECAVKVEMDQGRFVREWQARCDSREWNDSVVALHDDLRDWVPLP